jgi:hypothetical protein
MRVSAGAEWEESLRSSWLPPSGLQQPDAPPVRTKTTINHDLEEQLEAACAQASAAVEAARHASAQAKSVRRGVAAVLSRVGESSKRRPVPPPPAGG